MRFLRRLRGVLQRQRADATQPVGGGARPLGEPVVVDAARPGGELRVADPPELQPEPGVDHREVDALRVEDLDPLAGVEAGRVQVLVVAAPAEVVEGLAGVAEPDQAPVGGHAVLHPALVVPGGLVPPEPDPLVAEIRRQGSLPEVGGLANVPVGVDDVRGIAGGAHRPRIGGRHDAVNRVPVIGPQASVLGVGRAPATERAYRADWAAFQTWCAERSERPLPAPGPVVASYLDEVSRARSVATVRRRLAAVRAAHLDAGQASPTESPTVRAAVAWAEWQHRDGGATTRPVTIDELRLLSRGLPDTRAGRRDRALLLLGYGAGLRPGEIAGLDAGAVRLVPSGLRVDVARGRVLVPFGSAPELSRGAGLEGMAGCGTVRDRSRVPGRGSARQPRAAPRPEGGDSDRASGGGTGGPGPGRLPWPVASPGPGLGGDRAGCQRPANHGSHRPPQPAAGAPIHATVGLIRAAGPGALSSRSVGRWPGPARRRPLGPRAGPRSIRSARRPVR